MDRSVDEMLTEEERIEARLKIADAMIESAFDRLLYIYEDRDDLLVKYLPTIAKSGPPKLSLIGSAKSEE